ncbi:MAG TPA: FliA/WhiG family RNA polymerase sigma factor [Clostridiales bacterium]|nr:FliA/WhiG family RNA polymerase sigma factor [Clostridiales bacterium]
MSIVYEQKQDLESLVIQYLPLIQKIVNQISLKQVQYEKEDLIHIGVLGLIEAYKRYDSEKGVPFQHYAKWRIRGAILDELRKNGRVSRGKMEKIEAYYQARNEMQQLLKREPTAMEICKALSITLQELYDIEDSIHYLSQYSLENVLFAGHDGEFSLIDVMEDKSAQAPDERLLEEERKKSLTDAIEQLTEREQLILNLYYHEELTLKEIAEVLGVTISRVSQLHGQILLKLRGLLKTAD